MHVDPLDMYNPPAPNRLPGTGNPVGIDESVKQDMKMGVAVLVEFEHTNVQRRCFELASKIDTELCKNVVYVPNWISRDRRRIKGDR
jgi:hypothetical protein